jgi:hypothetical protein
MSSPAQSLDTQYRRLGRSHPGLAVICLDRRHRGTGSPATDRSIVARLCERSVAQDAIAVMFDRQGKLGRRPPAADPRIEISRAPIVRCNGIRPIAVPSVHKGQISPAQCAVLGKIVSVAGRR